MKVLRLASVQSNFAKTKFFGCHRWEEARGPSIGRMHNVRSKNHRSGCDYRIEGRGVKGGSTAVHGVFVAR